MSASTAPALPKVGYAAGAGSAGAASSSPPGSPSAAELSAFARAVRPPWWRALSPLWITTVFSAALFAVAAASPTTATLRRMLAEGDVVPVAGGSSTLDEAGGYAVPEHWSWPALSSPVEDSRVACDPALDPSAC